jgi:hypothetical protein
MSKKKYFSRLYGIGGVGSEKKEAPVFPRLQEGVVEEDSSLLC